VTTDWKACLAHAFVWPQLDQAHWLGMPAVHCYNDLALCVERKHSVNYIQYAFSRRRSKSKTVRWIPSQQSELWNWRTIDLRSAISWDELSERHPFYKRVSVINQKLANPPSEPNECRACSSPQSQALVHLLSWPFRVLFDSPLSILLPKLRPSCLLLYRDKRDGGREGEKIRAPRVAAPVALGSSLCCSWTLQ
jgi:hypothetical protein